MLMGVIWGKCRHRGERGERAEAGGGDRKRWCRKGGAANVSLIIQKIPWLGHRDSIKSSNRTGRIQAALLLKIVLNMSALSDASLKCELRLNKLNKTHALIFSVFSWAIAWNYVHGILHVNNSTYFYDFICPFCIPNIWDTRHFMP